MDLQMGEGGIVLLELDIVYLGMRVTVVNASHIKSQAGVTTMHTAGD